MHDTAANVITQRGNVPRDDRDSRSLSVVKTCSSRSVPKLPTSRRVVTKFQLKTFSHFQSFAGRWTDLFLLQCLSVNSGTSTEQYG